MYFYVISANLSKKFWTPLFFLAKKIMIFRPNMKTPLGKIWTQIQSRGGLFGGDLWFLTSTCLWRLFFSANWDKPIWKCRTEIKNKHSVIWGNINFPNLILLLAENSSTQSVFPLDGFISTTKTFQRNIFPLAKLIRYFWTFFHNTNFCHFALSLFPVCFSVCGCVLCETMQ